MTNEVNGITNEINGIVNGITNEINGIVNGITNEINGIGMEYRLGSILDFKFPLEKEVGSFHTSKYEEIYLERMPYLINTDDLLEELLRK